MFDAKNKQCFGRSLLIEIPRIANSGFDCSGNRIGDRTTNRIFGLPVSDTDVELAEQGLPCWRECISRPMHERFSPWCTHISWLSDGLGVQIRRDSFGLAPLFARRFEDRWVFSDSLKRLVTLRVPAVPQTASLREYIFYDGWIGTELPFRDVFQLPQGAISFWATTNSAPDLEVDCDVSLFTNATRPHQDSSISLEDVVRVLGDAMDALTIPSGRCGIFLSGGLDSGLLAAICRQRNIDAVLFTCGIDDPSLDETLFAGLVASSLSLRHEVVRLDRAGFLAGTVDAIHESAIPLMYPNQVGLALLARRATEVGVELLLSGEGADEVFCGYPRLLQLRDVLARSEGHSSSDYRTCFSDPELARDLQLLRSPFDLSVLGFGFPARQMLMTRIRDLLSPIEDETERELRIAWLHEFFQTLPCALLRFHNAVRRTGIKIAFPFVSRRAVEVGLESLPRLASLTCTKPQLRKMARHLLPRELLDRPKCGFEIPLERWLPSLRQIVGPGTRAALGLSADVLAKWAVQRPASADLRWPILNIEVWARLFVLHQSREEIAEWLCGMPGDDGLAAEPPVAASQWLAAKKSVSPRPRP
jgi:asparagine synthase (glutamine-hydrolysing)